MVFNHAVCKIGLIKPGPIIRPLFGRLRQSDRDRIGLVQHSAYRWSHGLNNYQTLKCRLYWSLIEFIDLRYSQSCWYLFSTGFVNYFPSNLLSG
jgi:hypothetical protein